MDVVKVERDELDDTHYCYKDSPVQCWCCRSPGILPTFLGQADRRVCDVVAGWWIREMVKRGGPAPSRSPSRSRSSKLWRRASCASLVGASERPCAPIGGASHVLGMAGPELRHGHSVGMGVVLHHLALGRRLMAAALLYLMQRSGVKHDHMAAFRDHHIMENSVETCRPFLEPRSLLLVKAGRTPAARRLTRLPVCTIGCSNAGSELSN